MSTDLIVMAQTPVADTSSFSISGKSPSRSSRRQKGSKSSSNDKQYDFEFPSGSMGLELEPVIVSSAKRVGCRVKHFHYDFDYNGHDPSFLEANVFVGDIVSKINGEVVVAWTFEDILMKLRALKNDKKTITFKNITATWTTSKARSDAPITPNKTPGRQQGEAILTPVSKSTSSSSFAEECIAQSPLVAKMLTGTTPVKYSRVDQENTINGSTPVREASFFSLKDPQSVSPVRSALSPKINGSNSSNRNRLSVSPLAVKELVAATTASRNRGLSSPLVTLSAPPLSKQQFKKNSSLVSSVAGNATKPSFSFYVESPTAEQQKIEEDRFIRLQQHRNEAATKLLSEFTSPSKSSRSSLAGVAATPSPSGWKTLRATPPSQKTHAATAVAVADVSVDDSEVTAEGELSESVGEEEEEEEQEDSLGEAVVPLNRIMGRVGETIDSALYSVEAALVGSAISVGTVLSQRAETALKNTSEYLPVYNNHEMKSVVNKKHDLLKELSQSYFLLGQVEASQDQRTKQLLATVEQLQLDNDRLSLRTKALEAEVSVLKSESQMDGNQMQTLEQTIQQGNDEKAELMLQMQESLINLQDLETVLEVTQRTLDHERVKHHNEVTELQAAMEAMSKEQAGLRQELTEAFESATARLNASEAGHSESEQKMQEELLRYRELEGSLQEEVLKLKENNALQQDWHKERLAEKVTEAQQLQSELMSATAGLQTMTKLHKEGEEVKFSLQSQLALVESELATVRGSNQKYKELLNNANQKIEAKTDELKALTDKVTEQAASIETVNAEKEAEMERHQVLSLQFGALQAELASTRGEMDCLNDVIKSHNIEVLQLQLKTNNTQEDVSKLEKELKDSRETCDEVRAQLLSSAEKLSEAKSEVQKKESEVSEKDALIAELQGQITSVYSLVDVLEKQKDDLTSRLELQNVDLTGQLNQQKVDLTNQVNQWKEKCDGLTQDCSTVSEDRDSLRSVESRLTEELKACGEALDQLRKENELLNEENKTMQADSESKYQFLDLRISTLTSERDNLVASHAVEVEKARKSLSESSTKVAQLEQLLSSLTAEKANMVMVSTAEKAESTRKHELELDLLQKQLLQLNTQNAQLLTLHTGTAQEKDRLIASLQQQVQRYQQEAEKSVVEKTRLMEENERLMREKTAELSSLMAACKTHEENINRMLSEREEYLQTSTAAAQLREKEFVTALSLAEDMQDSLRGDLHAKLQEIQKERETLKAALSEAQSSLKELESQLADSRATSQNLNDLHVALVAEHQGCVETHKCEMEVLQKKIQSQSSDFQALDAKHGGVLSQLKERESAIATLKETLKAGQELYNKAISENKVHVNELASQNTRIASLVKEAAEKESMMELGKKAMGLQKSKLAEESENNSKLVVECKQLMDQKNQLESTLESLRSFGASKVASLMSELTSLKDQLAGLRSEVIDLHLTHDSAMSSVAAKDTGSLSTISALQYELQAAENKLTASLSENSALLQKLTTCEQLNASCEKHISAQGDKIQTLEKTLVTMKDIHASGLKVMEVEHQSEVTKMHDSMKELMAKLVSSEEQLSGRVRALEETQTENATLIAKVTEWKAAAESHTRANDQLTLKTASLDSINASLQQQITFLEETYQSVQKNSNSELSHLQTKLQDLFKEKSDLELKCIRQEQEKAMAQSQFSQQMMTIKQDHETLLKNALGQHKAQLSAAQKEQEELLEGCRQDRAALIASYETQLQQMAASHSEKINGLREENLNETNRLKMTQVNQISDMRSEMESLMNERNNSIKTLSEELISLHDKYRNEEDIVGRNHASIVDELQLFIKSLKDDASKAFALLNQREDSIRNWQHKCGSAESELNGLRMDLTEKESTIRQLRQEQEELQSTLSVLQAELSRSETELSQLQGQCVLYQNDATVAREQEEELKSQVTSTHNELSVFMDEKRQQLSQLHKENSQFKASLVLAQDALQQMEDRFNSSQEDLLRCAADLKLSYARERSYADDVTDLEARLTDLQDQLLGKEGALTNQKSEVFEAMERTVRLEEELVVAREQVKIQEMMQDKSSKTLQSEVTEAHLQIQRLKGDNAQYKTKLQDLYSTVITQQQVLVDAESREMEHKSHVSKLETLVTKYEGRYREALAELMQMEKTHSEGGKRQDLQTKGLLDELASSQTKIMSLERELNYKRSEIDNLLQHVQMLVDATVSPVKTMLSGKTASGPTTRMRDSRTAVAAPVAAPVVDAVKSRGVKSAPVNPLRDITDMLAEDDTELENCHDKENSSHHSSAVDVHSGRQLGADKNSFNVFMSPETKSSRTHAAAAAVDGEVEVWRHNKWLDSLIVISLELHEIITFVLLDLSSSSAEVAGASVVSELKCLLTLLSKKHNSLHEIVVRPPWWVDGSNSSSTCIPSITPAHDQLVTIQMKGTSGSNHSQCNLSKEQIIRNLLQCSDSSPQRIHGNSSGNSGVQTVTDGIAYHPTSGGCGEVKSRSLFSLGEEFDVKLGISSSRTFSMSSAALEECDDVLRTSMDSDSGGAKSRSVRFSLEKGYSLPQAFPSSISHRSSSGSGAVEDTSRLISNDCDVSMDSLNSATDLNVSTDSEVGLEHETTFEEEDSLFVVLDESN